jgi:predicted nuclease with TOPRIM domain
LVDEGNENAAERLTELAAERGDLEELQRLSDEGYENAADRLSELIRNIK